MGYKADPYSDPGRSPRPPRFVALGGGTGLPTVLQGLASVLRSGPAETGGPWDISDRLSAIVAVTDDGGSSGRLRRGLGVLPPGDARNCLAALTAPSTPLSRVLQYRFAQGDLPEHPMGNLMLAALTQLTGDFATALEQLGTMLGVVGRVLPCCGEDVNLVGELEDGEILAGETAIVTRGKRVRRVWLDPAPRPVPDVIRALVNADLIVVGPGSLYTSIIPTLLGGGVAATISGSTALRLYVANLMTEPGETDGFTLEDHLRAIAAHAGRNLFDAILVNTTPLSAAARAGQAARGAVPVKVPGAAAIAGVPLLRGRFLVEHQTGDVRHSSERLADAMLAAFDRHARRRGARQSCPRQTKVRSRGGRSSVRPPTIVANPGIS